MARREQNGNSRGIRRRIAVQAGRIMAEEGITDHLAAKRKAAARLGVAGTRHLPRNEEVEQALVEHQRLFQAQTQPTQLRALRQAAVEAMSLLTRFDPRLVGPVLRGTAGARNEVSLHAFTDTAEELGWFLMDHRIPYEVGEKRLRRPQGGVKDYPRYSFLAGEIPVEVTVFPAAGLRQPPPSEVDGGVMQRAGIDEVRGLLSEST